MTAPAKPSSSPPSSSGSDPPRAPADPPRAPADPEYAVVRAASLALVASLSPEDMLAQSMPDASPVKWHLAHTTWFFETFVLAELPEFRPFHPGYAALFNSYYNSVGAPYPRGQRGLLTRPDLSEVLRYRQHVDHAIRRALAQGLLSAELSARVRVGLHHEQQHQELILTDVLHLLSQNPLRPAFRQSVDMSLKTAPADPDPWHAHPGGVVQLGHRGDDFCFDNELPRHRVLLAPFEIAARPVDNAAYLQFIRDGAYRRPELWLSDAWDAVHRHGWFAPLYWSADLETRFTLHGLRPIDPAAPVCHVSYYEADAFARWAGARLPGEHEWESVAEDQPITGNFVESGRLEPVAHHHHPQSQFFGDVWVWTASPYVAYPGFRPATGALGEYNGKFMCNQIVLRGGSCATPGSHVRASYRNFFPPEARWQFSGLRLAR